MKIRATGSSAVIGAFLVALAALPAAAMAGSSAQGNARAGWMAKSPNIEVVNSSPTQNASLMIVTANHFRHSAGWMAEGPTIPTSGLSLNPNQSLVASANATANTGWARE